MVDYECDLATLADNPEISSRLWIAPTILRLAEKRNAWDDGQRVVEVGFCRRAKGKLKAVAVQVSWSLSRLALDYQYATIRTELAQLRSSKNVQQISEEAALGVAFLLVATLLPRDRITRVVQVGGRGDFYLNGRRDQMIEVSGTRTGSLDVVFLRKRSQILLNRALTKAIVSVTRFEAPASRLERVR